MAPPPEAFGWIVFGAMAIAFGLRLTTEPLLDEMLEAANERRRASGRPEISEDGIREEIADEERKLRETLGDGG